MGSVQAQEGLFGQVGFDGCTNGSARGVVGISARLTSGVEPWRFSRPGSAWRINMAPWTPYSPGTKKYPELSSELQLQLAAIEPSQNGSIAYRPCAVVLASGEVHERVYVQDAQSYITVWGVWPEDDPGKGSVDVSNVIAIRESSDRLHPSIARSIYRAGESGMGYTVFTLVFRDGSARAYVGGNAVDFVTYSAGKAASDVVSVVPHRGRDEDPYSDPRGYAWCLYGTGRSSSSSRRWSC
jgi:hypothetical protein